MNDIKESLGVKNLNFMAQLTEDGQETGWSRCWINSLRIEVLIHDDLASTITSETRDLSLKDKGEYESESGSIYHKYIIVRYNDVKYSF
jgi:hypothetical protein